jgi:hypothetical protein
MSAYDADAERDCQACGARDDEPCAIGCPEHEEDAR